MLVLPTVGSSVPNGSRTLALVLTALGRGRRLCRPGTARAGSRPVTGSLPRTAVAAALLLTAIKVGNCSGVLTRAA